MNDPSPQQPNPDKIQKALDAIQEQREKLALQAKGPYYTEHYAERVKKILDRLISRRIPQRIDADEISVNTARLQYYQGAAYLRDHDPHYAAVLKTVKCMTFNRYIELHLRKEARFNITDSVPWRAQFEDFLENSIQGQKLERTDVLLSDEEVTWIKNALLPLESMFISEINNKKILVIHYEDKIT